ncbi:hypothetical protein MHH28_07810 [Paenibacillus sp. FSL K6-1217]|uniref:hypothetical protein n=1 Tax=Paenibacillus sp. FSL K6-1217 TaxID=2921466 RepID=UPI00324CCB16
MNKLTGIKQAYSEIKNSRQEYVLTGEYEDHVGYLLSLLEEKDKALTYIQERAEFELDIENTNTYNLSNGLTMIRQKAYEAINTSSNNEREV